MQAIRTTARGATALLAFLCAVPALAADGLPDPSFGTAGAAYITPDDVEARELRPYAAAVLPDGKVLVAGERNKFIPSSPFDPHMRGMLARFDADGSVDASFGNVAGIPGVLVLPDLVPDTGAAMQVIEAMRVLDDGSIVVAGTAQAFGPLRGFVVKLAADGQMDPAFGSGGLMLIPDVYLHALAVDSRGRIVVAGEKAIDTISHSFVARLGRDGQPDSEFGPAADGTLVLDWDGVTGQGGYLTSLAVTADDGLVVGGSYEVYGMGMGSDFAAARLHEDGTFDTTFAGTGWRVFHSADIAAGTQINGIDRLLAAADGSIVFAGHYNDDATGVNVLLGRLHADGTSDEAFGEAATPGYQRIAVVPDAWNRLPTGLVAQSDGRLVVSVSYATPGKSSFMAVRTLPTGALDAGFADGGVLIADLAPEGVFSDASALTLDAAGRPVLAGASERTTSPPLYDLTVLRLTQSPLDRLFADGFD
jgi:uncharacterized delta-60 repeat protein